MDASLFGWLPSELCNDIYHLLLPKPTNITVNVCRGKLQRLAQVNRRDIHALARTCKDIYRECMSLHYAQNQWRLILHPFYLNASSHVVIRREHGIKEVHDWSKAIRSDMVRCISAMKLVVTGHLALLSEVDETSMQDARSLTQCIALSIRSIKAKLSNGTPLGLDLSLPLGRPPLFGALPAELRNNIYGSLLPKPGTIIIDLR